MRRREFITLAGGAAAAYSACWLRHSHAEPTGKPVIGLLNGQYPTEVARYVATFRESLKEAGFVEGQNVAVEYRYADGRRERIAALAAELVQLGVNVIFTGGGTPVTVAAKAATTTVPIVFTMGGDPVQLGIVAALNRPSGNATGVCFLFNALGPKRLELLREVVPSAKVIGYLVNPTIQVCKRKPATFGPRSGRSVLSFATSTCAMHRRSMLPSLALRSTGLTRSWLLQTYFSSNIVTN
jgi:putative ABC transport system substrate-binding protein